MSDRSVQSETIIKFVKFGGDLDMNTKVQTTSSLMAKH